MLSQLSYSPVHDYADEVVVAYPAATDAPRHSCDVKVVGLGRVELPTSPLSGVRSNQLSYRPKLTSP